MTGDPTPLEMRRLVEILVEVFVERGGNRVRAGGAARVTDAALEEIARRAAELVADHVREPFRLLDTHSVARMLAVSEEWVREHAAELGAVRVGDGPKGALRFDAARIRVALERRRLDRPTETKRRRPGRQRRSLGVVPPAVPADVTDW